MNIAVIGATGLIGHHTALAVLALGHDLTIIHRASSNLETLNGIKARFVQGDLDDPQSLIPALQNVDAVINCAAYYPTTPKPWKQEVQTALTQMEHFYAACEQTKLQKIVYLGAAIALKRPSDGSPATETSEYTQRPPSTNPYVQVKWALDQQAKHKAAAGLPVVIGIPSMTFGEYDYGPTTGQLIVEIGNQTLPGYFRGKRNVIYAGDAGRGLVLACEKGQVGQRYLFTGQNIEMDELVPKIAQATGTPPLKAIPLTIVKWVARLQTLRFYCVGTPPKISQTAIAVISAGQFLDGSHSNKALGFKAQMPLDDTLKRCVKWFRATGYLKQ